MSPEQFSVILTAVTALVAALTGLAVQIRAYHAAVNSRMDQLLELTRSSSHAEGVKEGSSSQVQDE